MISTDNASGYSVANLSPLISTILSNFQELKLSWQALREFMREKHRTTPLWLKVLIPILGLGSLGVVAVLGAVLAFVVTAWLGQPVPVLGFDQSVEQPIPVFRTSSTQGWAPTLTRPWVIGCKD